MYYDSNEILLNWFPAYPQTFPATAQDLLNAILAYQGCVDIVCM